MNQVSSEEKNTLATVMASSVHEIKNSFNVLLNEVEQLNASLPKTDGNTASISHIQSEALYISGQLTALLANYKQSEGEFSVSVEHHSLDDFLDDITQRYQSTLCVAFDCKIGFECDEGLLGFFNEHLISNVIDTGVHNAAREQGVSEIILSACIDQDYLRIDINDNGPGFPESITKQLAKDTLNHSASSNNKPTVSSALSDGKTGLGLHFARCMLSLHENKDCKGYITAQNQSPLGGAQLTLMLPR